VKPSPVPPTEIAVRLNDLERQTIVHAIRSADPDAVVYLFGSRTDETARGGDIDLLVLSDRIDLMTKLDILGQLHAALGEQHIDLVVFSNLAKPFARFAAREGQRL
jgi:predicted nucleotidyltransferase